MLNKEQVIKALQDNKHNVQLAADALEVKKITVYKAMERFKLRLGKHFYIIYED